LWKNRIEEIEGKLKELEHSAALQTPAQGDHHIRSRQKKGGAGVGEQFNKEIVEFNQAKKIERKIMKSMQRPAAPPPSATGDHGSTKKVVRRRSSHESSELVEESKLMKEAEEGLPPPEDEISTVGPSPSKLKTPPPNLSIFRGGVVS
jgi:hypothetical protein